MRSWLVLLGLLCAGAALCAVLYLRPEGIGLRQPGPDPSAAQPPTAPAAAASTPELPQPAEAGSSQQRGAVEIPQALDDPDRFELLGSLIVLDAEGVAHAEESGSFALEWGRWPDVHNREVHVQRGRFREFVPADTELECSAFRLGGRVARIDQARVKPDPDGRLVLTLHWGRASSLSVVDHDSGAPLAGVEVAGGLRGDRLRDRLQTEIDPAAIVLRDQSSPLLLPPELGNGGATLWVGAPGYAWSRVDVDLFGGGAREVRLRAAGELEVEVAGLAADTPAVLRLAGGPLPPAPGALLTRACRPDETLRLSRLPAGIYEVRIELGLDPASAETLGAEGVEVRAGLSTPVRIELDPREPRESAAPLSGLLRLPRAYHAARPALLIAVLEGGTPARASQLRLELSAMRELEAELFAWDAGDLAPGRYLIEVLPLSLRRVLELGPTGERDLLLEVPAPGELVVVPFDADSGERIAGAIATWHAQTPEGLSFWTTERVLADPRTLQCEIVAPAGELVLNVNAPGFAPARVLARVEPGRSALSVPMQRPIEVRLALFDGAARVPYGPQFHFDAAEIDGSGRVLSWKNVDGDCLVAFSNPGFYRFSLRVPPEFQTPPPLEAQVQAGASSPISIQLLRR